MDYIEFSLHLLPGHQPDILMAQLADLGFESFLEPEEGILGYVRQDLFDPDVFLPTLNEMVTKGILLYRYTTIPGQNWNAVWESNYDPVVIDNKCMVRAPFHEPVNGMPIDIVISPKMSFGTAHHETTTLMARALMEENPAGQRVLDMGCGTGILAILACKLGAHEVVAIDNDEWAFANAIENIEINNTSCISVLRGEAADIPLLPFNLVMANINRNILLCDMAIYTKALVPSGTLLISGFYEEDLEPIQIEASRAGLRFVSIRAENKWVAAKFVK